MASQDVADLGGQDEFIEFPVGAPIQLPAGFPPLPMNIYSEWGFKLKTLSEEGCADVKVWTAATEDDYRTMVARMQNVRPEDVDPTHIHGPHGKRCNLWNGACAGRCDVDALKCRPKISIRDGMASCVCR
ncbi:hypothetical protein [Streptomyces sp. NPDC051219]|uniref:hypothetical protein n=1 Tax=Streptomyces sp. NPDC051219 TaxID=3155283 RepID=UPI00342C3616